MNKYAFISYSHQDKDVAKWLHKQLESYKLPTGMSNDFIKSRYLRPVFRDEEDLNTGVLSEELHKHLSNSRFLIVICSKAVAASKWVNEEIEFFKKNREWSNIIPVLVNDDSCNSEELWPEAIRKYVGENDNQELLGISYFPNRRKAFIQVVSKMLGVDFDVLWRRHQKARRRMFITMTVLLAVIMVLFYYFAMPVSLKVVLQDQPHSLPYPDDAVLMVNKVEYPLSRLDTMLVVKSLPGYLRGRKVNVRFRATYYQSESLDKRLGIGISNKIQVNIRRDSTFGVFSGNVIDENGCPVEDAEIHVGTITALSDSNGNFHIVLPLPKQESRQKIRVSKDGFHPYEREDEVPSCSLSILLFR